MKTIRMIACLILTACLPVLAASDFTATFNPTFATGMRLRLFSGDEDAFRSIKSGVHVSENTVVETNPLVFC